MAELATQTISSPGKALNLAAADALGDSAVHANNVRLYVLNNDENPIDVTVTSKVTANAPTGPLNLVFEAPAGKLTVIPLGNGGFKDPVTGRVAWSYDAVTDVLVAVVAG